MGTTGPRQWLLLLEALSRALVTASICRLLVQEVVRARHWARIPIGLGHSCLVVLGAKDVGGLSLPVSGITDARACYAITNASACSKTNPVAYNSVHASRPRSVADW